MNDKTSCRQNEYYYYFEQSPVCLIVTDKKDKIKKYNKSAGVLLCPEGENLTGKFLSLFLEEDALKLFEEKKKLLFLNQDKQVLEAKIYAGRKTLVKIKMALTLHIPQGKKEPDVIISILEDKQIESGKTNLPTALLNNIEETIAGNKAGYVNISSVRINDEPEKTVIKTIMYQSELQAGMVWENTFDGLILFDEKGIIEKVNPALCILVDKQANELVGKSVEVIFSDESRERVMLNYFDKLAAKMNESYEDEITLWNGKKIWIERTNFLFNAEKGKIFLGSIVRNINARKKNEAFLLNSREELEEEVKKRVTELSKINKELNESIRLHKNLEQSLQYSRRFLNKIINAVSNPIYVKDEKHTYILVNSAFCNLVEKNKYEVIDKNEFDIFNNENARMVYEKDESLLKREASELNYQFEMQINGKRKIMVVKKEFFEDENEEKFIVCSAVEITKIVQAEEEILNALHKEKELNELKSKFVSMVSHEYRTPLTAIMSSVELLELFGSDMLTDEKKRYYDRIYASIKYLTGMLNDILTLNRTEAGKMIFNPAELEVVGFCRKLAADTMYSFSNKVNILVSSTHEEANLNLDAKLLNLILANLLANAVKYSFQGSEIFFILEIREKSILFIIKDKGTGIPKEEHSKIFEAFFRAKNVLNIPGSGLGLSIVKRCVDLHNGKVSFTSEENVGTEFRVILPY